MTHDRPLGGFLLEVVRGGKSKGLERGSHYCSSYRSAAEKVKGRFRGKRKEFGDIGDVSLIR